MDKVRNFIEKNWKTILLILMTVVFFSTILMLSYDSAHYLNYLEIFEGKQPFSNWDVVRGPVFPLIIYFATKIFGRTAMGILAVFYLFYLIYIYCISKMLDKLIVENRYKLYIKLLILCFFAFNPIVLGYYHTLLTENVAITIMTASCLVAWNWTDDLDKKSKIWMAIYFVIMATVAYFLKQPYVYTVVVPMLIAIIYKLIKNHSKNNLKYYGGTFIALVLVLALSIVSWNKILISKGVEMKKDRTSDGMLSSQIITGSTSIKMSVVDDYNTIKKDKYLSKFEKDIIKKRDKKDLSTVVLTIKDEEKIVDKDIVEVEKTTDISTAKSVSILGQTFFKHPAVLSSAYLRNYCSMSSLCEVKMNEEGLYTSSDINWKSMYENSAIAYKTFSNWGSFYYLSEDGEIRAADFRQNSNVGDISKAIIDHSIITNVIYKLTLILLPLFIIGMFVVKKVLNNKLVDEQSKIYKFTMFLFLSTFTCLFANTFVGLMLDRYAVFAFPVILLGYVGFVSFIVSLFISKQEPKKKLKKKSKKNSK